MRNEREWETFQINRNISSLCEMFLAKKYSSKYLKIDHNMEILQNKLRILETKDRPIS